MAAENSLIINLKKMKKILLFIISCANILAYGQNAITWSSVMNIAPGSYGNLHPRIVTDASGNPLVIWGRNSDATVFFSRWNGNAFTSPVQLNPMGFTIATASWMGPDIAAKGDTVYVVMKRTPESSNANHIYITHSFDGGATFSTPVQVDFIADSISRFPTVTTDNAGNPIVGFMKFNSAFLDSRWAVAKSNNFGNTFSTDVKASGWSGTNALVCDCCPGAVVNSGNTVALLYRDNLNNLRDIWAGVSTDGGSAFTLGMPVDQGNWVIPACPASGPDGVIIGDTLYTTYMSGASGTSLVYLSKSLVAPGTGSTGTPLTDWFSGLSSQNYPRVAGAGNALAVVWKQYVNNTDQLALRYTNNIASGLPAAYDTVDTNDIANADVALTDGNVFVVWEDDNSGTVKYRKGTFPSATGIEKNSFQNQFIVYPNPVSGFLYIQLPLKENVKISVMDVIGRQIFSGQIEFSQNKIQLNTSNWNTGIYFLKIITGNQTVTSKIVKQ